jgi:hypothetical protein
MIGAFILSFTSCKFEGNRRLLEGCCIHIVNEVFFENDDCKFKDCVSSLISSEVFAKSIRFGHNSLKGSGCNSCYGMFMF